MSDILPKDTQWRISLKAYARYTKTIKDYLPKNLVTQILYDGIERFKKITQEGNFIVGGYTESLGSNSFSFLDNINHVDIVEIESNYYASLVTPDKNLIVSNWLLITIYICFVFAGGSTTNSYGMGFYKYDLRYSKILKTLYDSIDKGLSAPLTPSEQNKVLSFLRKYFGESDKVLSKDLSNYDENDTFI